MTDTAAGTGADPPAPEKPGLLTRLGRHGYAVLTVLCLVLWLPGIVSLPALDRDESRFAQSSRQMLDSGNYVDIRFGHVPRYKKPVGIYWLQAAATALAAPATSGDHGHIWTYRLPSLAGGLAATWLTFWIGAELGGPAAGLVAGLLMAFSVLLTAEASIATTDAVLLAAVLGVQGVLLRVYRAARDGEAPPTTRLVLAGWIACAAGILVKFPIVPGVALATVAALAAWDRKGAWLKGVKPVRGLLLAAVLVAPWLIAIAVQSRGAFFQQSLGNDFAAKVAGGQESHGAPPGYYLLLSAITFWPAVLFVLPGIGNALDRKSAAGPRFLLAWAGSWWLLVEAVPTKLPHYVLPAYPALAILAALWLTAPPVPAQGWQRVLPWIALVQFLISLAAAAAVLWWVPRAYGAGAGWPVMVVASVVGLCGLAATILCLMGRRLMALGPALVAALALIPCLTALVAPGLDRLWLSQRLAAAVARDSRPGDPPPALAGYEEPSLVFALGADVGLTDGAGAAQMGAAQGGLALVDDTERPAFLARLAELQADAAPVDALSGFDYSRGRGAHVTLYRVAPLRPVTRPLPP